MRKNTLLKVAAICLAAALSLSLLGGIGTFADAETMTESVYVYETIEIATGVRINVTTYDDDGNAETKQFIPQDANGDTVYPFITNGTTYLPVRAVSELFGATIDWNTFYSAVSIATSKAEEKTVTNPNPSAVDTSSVTAEYSTVSAVTGVNIYVDNEAYTPTDANGSEVDVILIDGTTYLPVRAMTKIFLGSDTSDQISWDGTSYTVTISSPVPASTSGDTEDADSDSIISTIINAMKEQFGDLLDPLGLLDKFSDMNDLIFNNDGSSSFLSLFESMFDENALSDLFSNSGFSLEDIMSAFDADSEDSLFSKVSSAFLNSFGDSDDSIIEKALSFFIFTRAIDWLF